MSKKCQKVGDTPSKVLVVIPLFAHSPSKRPPSSTLSLKVMVSSEGGARGKFVCKPFPLTFWDNADVVSLKAHEALSVDDLNPLMSKLSGDVMSSHIQKLVQALGESLFISGKLLDLEKKVATVEPMIKFLSTENETLKNKIAILTVEAKNDKEHVAALEKSLQVEKDFSKLKDKQIGDLQFKLKKASPDAVWEFKESNLYSNDLLEKEFVVDRPSEVTEENVVEEPMIVASVDPSPSNPARQ
nr:hypothetical protein CFP56_27706 [Quercus suber]